MSESEDTKQSNSIQNYKNRMACKYSREKSIKSKERKERKQKNKNNGLFKYKPKPKPKPKP